MPGLIPESGETHDPNQQNDQHQDADQQGGDQQQDKQDGQGGDQQADRPDWVPEALWKDGAFDQAAFDALNSRPEGHADVPASAEAYALPAIEGLDAEAAGASPLFAALREGAFENGLGQVAFEKVVTAYVERETARAEEFENQQLALLGNDADARLKRLGEWLDRTYPAEQAAALRTNATTAAGVLALEATMNRGVTAKPRVDPPPPVKGKTREEIEALMKSKAYSGTEAERDKAVIKEVDDWFAANAKPKARK
jgi:hypothetical protein